MRAGLKGPSQHPQRQDPVGFAPLSSSTQRSKRPGLFAPGNICTVLPVQARIADFTSRATMLASHHFIWRVCSVARGCVARGPRMRKQAAYASAM